MVGFLSVKNSSIICNHTYVDVWCASTSKERYSAFTSGLHSIAAVAIRVNTFRVSVKCINFHIGVPIPRLSKTHCKEEIGVKFPSLRDGKSPSTASLFELSWGWSYTVITIIHSTIWVMVGMDIVWVTIETKDDNETCRHIAIYSLSIFVGLYVLIKTHTFIFIYVYIFVSMWAELIVLPKMHCTCVWAAGVAEQHDDQRAHKCVPTPSLKVPSVTVGRRASPQNFLTASTK